MTERVGASIRTVTDPADLAAVHAEVLAPNFPADELPDAASFVAEVGAGRRGVLVAEASGGCRGAAVVERVSARTSLLAWLAVDDSCRGRGVGAALLDAALAACWEPGVTLVVAEIELPGRTPTDQRHGDPARRARFYAQRGARALGARHWQPPVADDAEFVELLLIAFPDAAGRLDVDPDAVAEFQRAYLAGHEGTDAWQAALAVADAGVALTDLGRLYGF